MKKLTRKEAIVIVRKFISEDLIKKTWYKNIQPYAKAIVLYGSTAKGLNRIDSDIDFLIFVPVKIEKKYTKGEYFYQYKGREINIVLRSIERLRRLAKKHNNTFQAEIFRKSYIIWEKDKEIRECIKKMTNSL